ncbi:3'-5' exonuclease [Paenibacillus sp. Z6-24]
MDFVTIDFETANSSRASACSIGVVEISGGEITTERSWLINPQQHFDAMNISIHNITSSMVQDAPTFGELWPDLLPYLENKHVVAHNAAFDMSVLRHSLDAASAGYPAFQYYCTYLLSKKILNELPSHRLNNLAAYFGIELNHHDALEDARAAALVLLQLMERKQQFTPAELSAAFGYKPGTLYSGGYTAFSAAASKTKKPGSWKKSSLGRYS